MPNKTAAIILAAGDGTRMKSARPKVCCEVLFKPMLSWVVSACEESGVEKENICVVVSDRNNEVALSLDPAIAIAVQEERKGTGHAALMAQLFMAQAIERGVTDIMVLCGDAPFISKEDMMGALAFHKEHNNMVTVISAVIDEPAAYGRIVRRKGHLAKIVEKKNATPEILSIQEINSGAYWFSMGYLITKLSDLIPNDVTGEYYLTDLVEICVKNSLPCDAFPCHAHSVLGANDRTQLCLLNEVARNDVIVKHQQNGVSIPIRDSIIITTDVQIGLESLILPGTILKGNTIIGENCVIGPNTIIDNCQIASGTTIEYSKLTDSTIGSQVKIGPFAQLRPNSHIADKVKIGNFVEVKNSTVGEKTSLAHLTYIGDSDFGSHINVGCGVVTVNYDGKNKYRTTVEDDVFIGCNTNLIAPVKVGKGAYVAAASTVTEDVESDALAIGRVRVVQKAGRAVKYRK